MQYRVILYRDISRVCSISISQKYHQDSHHSAHWPRRSVTWLESVGWRCSGFYSSDPDTAMHTGIWEMELLEVMSHRPQLPIITVEICRRYEKRFRSETCSGRIIHGPVQGVRLPATRTAGGKAACIRINPRRLLPTWWLPEWAPAAGQNIRCQKWMGNSRQGCALGIYLGTLTF